MAEDKLPPRALPRLRVTSHSFADLSQSTFANASQRTVSSSTSMLSTPSNYRRVQQMNKTHSKPKSKPDDVRVSGMSSTANATKKLLNLQQLKKAQAKVRPFTLRKPMSMSKYDHTVFTRHCGTDDDSDLPPPLKESQIRAWESAEKISANVIFDNERPTVASEGLGIFDSGAADISVDDDSQIEGDDSMDRSSLPRHSKVILSLPGYTKGELKIIMENFEQLKNALTRVSAADFDEAEKKALWIYRQQQSVAQERAFKGQHTLTGKRKVQVYHKKDFLRKLFGYSNNVNQEHITNNTSYSAFDNAANAQKALHEDKEEIMSLLEEDKAFELEMKEVRLQLQAQRKGQLEEADDVSLADLTAERLTIHYEGELNMAPIDDTAEQELVACTLGHLKQCVKELRNGEDPL